MFYKSIVQLKASVNSNQQLCCVIIQELVIICTRTLSPPFFFFFLMKCGEAGPTGHHKWKNLQLCLIQLIFMQGVDVAHRSAVWHT